MFLAFALIFAFQLTFQLSQIFLLIFFLTEKIKPNRSPLKGPDWQENQAKNFIRSKNQAHRKTATKDSKAKTSVLDMLNNGRI